MIHTKYDLSGALESAQNAAKRTNRVRYVVTTPMGYQIVSKPPKKVLYKVWKLDKSRIKSIL